MQAFHRTIEAATLATLLLLGACSATPSGGPAAPARAQFERFVALEGDWRITGGDHTVGATHTYRTIANGSAVVETIFPGQPHEMVTVYHLDGPSLVLTHYCALGNQPRMVAEPGEGDVVRFLFDSGGNLAADTDPHMHDARFTFVDAERFTSTWTQWDGGVEIERMVMELERIAP
ncbi:MAG: hypothetical protein QF903_04405 [Planctomycetota bacterium]|jgi:hypothetical protein|nr:hypothetical protein [Planctomycetota bacterium]MDP6764341.1 hypothetical protein [Planctomycetota bacterium]MDP6988699.1 hypothetical protein [Planctomycetota bacterium]